MPKQIQEIKDFLLTARRKDAKSVKIKKNKGNTKFKVGNGLGMFHRSRGETACLLDDLRVLLFNIMASYDIKMVSINFEIFLFLSGAMQPLSVHVGGPRSGEGGEAEAVPPARPRRQGVEMNIQIWLIGIVSWIAEAVFEVFPII